MPLKAEGGEYEALYETWDQLKARVSKHDSVDVRPNPYTFLLYPVMIVILYLLIIIITVPPPQDTI